MTVGENVAYPLKLRGVALAAREERVRRALDAVQMAAYAERRIDQLSGGQRQRVAVARAMVFEPNIILMDEPLSALDKRLREEMQVELKHLHDRLGRTIIYVTHDQKEALTMSDRVAVLKAEPRSDDRRRRATSTTGRSIASWPTSSATRTFCRSTTTA